jgi:hypothetical protein
MATVKTRYIQVEGHSNLLRDESSTAIVSNDMSSYELHKRRRETFKVQKNEINTLKDEVSEIKNLLHTLIEKVNG